MQATQCIRKSWGVALQHSLESVADSVTLLSKQRFVPISDRLGTI
jgi:hypothetical protein